MTCNNLLRPTVGANYDLLHYTPATCRGRFIVPTAALSALRGYSHIPIILFLRIIGPRCTL